MVMLAPPPLPSFPTYPGGQGVPGLCGDDKGLRGDYNQCLFCTILNSAFLHIFPKGNHCNQTIGCVGYALHYTENNASSSLWYSLGEFHQADSSHSVPSVLQ